MMASDKNPLYHNIKAAIELILPASNKVRSALEVTDQIRYDILKVLVSYADQVPHPASGFVDNSTQSKTLIRWQILAYIAGVDLTLAKWFESHLDALSILNEVGYDSIEEGLWAVWASEGPPLTYDNDKVKGTKAWCSGSNIVDHGLITYRDTDGKSQLLIVDMHQNGIEIDNSDWQAVGMQATDTGTVKFDQAPASQVGAANAYLDRVGFWHGAAGVAACWYGATANIAAYLNLAYQHKPNQYKAMYLGQISTSLAITHQYFNFVANLIDSQPHLSHELAIRQLRANVEQLTRQVLETVGLALGAAPFCRNAHFARLSADLPVFIRQSHGAFDWQIIGELTSELSNQLSNELGNELVNELSNESGQDLDQDVMDEQVNIWQL